MASKDDLLRLVNSQPTLSSGNGGIEKDAPPTPDPDQPGQDGLTGQEDEDKPNAAPPVMKPACPRPANGKPDSPRPANERPSSLASSVLPAKETKPDDGWGVKVCTYQEGGVCSIHGSGARLRWKHIGRKVVDQEMKRKYWYECRDLNKEGKKLKQTKLILFMAQADDTQGV